MDLRSFMMWLGQALQAPLFQLAGKPVSLFHLLLIAGVFAATLLASALVRKGIRKGFALRGLTDEGQIGTVTRLVHYTVLAFGVMLALETAGIQLSALFAAGAVFAVGVGFAMQNIAQNFVSGVILLTERAIKPGDVLEVDGELVKVASMRIRSTVVRNLDENELIIPNSVLAQSTVKNFTMSDSLCRIGLVVGVAYSSDMAQVLEVLSSAVQKLSWPLKHPEPTVLLREFSASSVDFSVSVWIKDPWQSRIFLSKLHFTVWDALLAANITIAFPQLDIHLDSTVTEKRANTPKVA